MKYNAWFNLGLLRNRSIYWCAFVSSNSWLHGDILCASGIHIWIFMLWKTCLSALNSRLICNIDQWHFFFKFLGTIWETLSLVYFKLYIGLVWKKSALNSKLICNIDIFIALAKTAARRPSQNEANIDISLGKVYSSIILSKPSQWAVYV
jgi:hypothetical protein